MLEKLIIPGEKLELREVLNGSNTERRANVYLSQVYDIEDDDKKLRIAMPIKEGRIIPLAVGARFDAFFYTKRGLYEAQLVITDRFKTSNLYVLIVEVKSELKKFQRRQFYRFETMIQIDYTVMNPVEEKLVEISKQFPENIEESRISKGTTLDISGGGMRFASAVRLEKSDKLYIEFPIAVSQCLKKIKAAGRIIDSVTAPNRAGVYHNRVEFEQISPEDREVLIKFIFEEERKIRKNERMV